MQLPEITHYRMQRLLAEGYQSLAEIQNQLEASLYQDVKVDEVTPELISLLHNTLHEKWMARLEEQKSWPETTDNERLAAAFADLESQGIIARENWTCCQSCGHAEIGDEMIAYVELHKRVPIGYTFFHQQTTEAAAEGYDFYLAYGATDPSDEAAVQIGHQVVATLKQHGINAEWDGDIHRGISISDFDWKRRLPAPNSAISLN